MSSEEAAKAEARGLEEVAKAMGSEGAEEAAKEMGLEGAGEEEAGKASGWEAAEVEASGWEAVVEAVRSAWTQGVAVLRSEEAAKAKAMGLEGAEEAMGLEGAEEAMGLEEAGKASGWEAAEAEALGAEAMGGEAVEEVAENRTNNHTLGAEAGEELLRRVHSGIQGIRLWTRFRRCTPVRTTKKEPHIASCPRSLLGESDQISPNWP